MEQAQPKVMHVVVQTPLLQIEETQSVPVVQGHPVMKLLV